MGAFLGILNKISLFRIKRDDSTCTHCNLCSKVCPMNIDVAKLKSVYRAECINCMECVTVCPTKKDTLKTTIIGKAIKPIIIIIIGIVIYLGVIGITNLTGVWKTTESSLTEVVGKEGNLDPYSIRGFMTLKDISETFHIDIKQIYSELQLDINNVPPTVKAKELSTYNPNLNEDSVREAVAKIIGFNRNDEKPSEETKDNTNIDTSTIKGSMTIKEVCETFGINKDDLLKTIDAVDSIPETYTLKELKEHMQQTNPQFEVEDVRNAVKQLITKKNQ
jgi:ferredoxin